MLSHFLIGVLPSERPGDTSLVLIEARLPGVDLGNQCGPVWQAAVKTLAIQDANLDFSHIQPTGVFRSVVKGDATQKCLRLLKSENVLEALAEVGVEVIHDQMDAARCGIDLFRADTGRRPRSRVWRDGR